MRLLVLLRVKMAVFMTPLTMLVLMVMRLMGHQNHHRDNNIVSSVMKTAIFTLSHTKSSTIIRTNVMRRIIVNRWALAYVATAVIVLYVIRSCTNRSLSARLCLMLFWAALRPVTDLGLGTVWQVAPLPFLKGTTYIQIGLAL